MKYIVVLLALAGVPGFAAAQEVPAPRVTVTGEGRVEAAPDMATVSLGVSTEADTAALALAENSAQVAQVLATLTAAGVAERDVQTSGLSLSPRWDGYGSDSGAAPKVVGYTAANTVTVRIRVLADLGGVLDAVVSSGANTLNGLAFGMSAPEPLLDQARQRAVADAMRKAALFAGAAGVTLGPVRMIDEASGYSQPAPMFRMDAEMSSAPAVPVAGGEVSLTATVTMVFDLK